MAAFLGRSQELGQCVIKCVTLMIKPVFLTVKVAYFESETVILTILGHTEGAWVSKVSKVICFFSRP